MNIKQISIIISVILLVVLSGVVIFTMTGSDTEPNVDDGPQPFDTGDSIISNAPPGITEENQNLEINETQLVNSHTDIIESNSVLVSITENDVKYEIQKNENIYVEREHFDKLTEKYATSEYTITKNNNNRYLSTNQTISPNEYTKESTFKYLLKYLEVDTFSETEDGDIEIILSHGEDNEYQQLSNAYGFENINYVSITLTITTEGLIKDSDIEIIGESSGVKEVYEESYNISDIGDFTVDSPNWLSDAENTISIVDGLYNRIDGQMVIQHHGLTTVPEGHPIEITNMASGETVTKNLPREFKNEDSLGLSYDGNEWDVTINEVPEDGVSIDSNRFRIVAENNNQDYFNIILRS